MSDAPRAIAPMPPDGVLEASLENLRIYVGARSTTDDVLLTQRLYVATEYVYEHTYTDHWPHANVQEAILLLASRLYKRRQTPEGQGGFAGAGFVGLTAEVHVVAADPDIEALLDRHRDWKRTAGIG